MRPAARRCCIGTGLAATALLAAALLASRWCWLSVHGGRGDLSLGGGCVWARWFGPPLKQPLVWEWRPMSPPSLRWGFGYDSASRPGLAATRIIAPLWPLVLLTGSATALLWWRGRPRAPARACQGCRYDLSGLAPGAACPECGGR